ncbi:MAG: TRAP transporter small permease [Hyphomicrobiaceae bacterium]
MLLDAIEAGFNWLLYLLIVIVAISIGVITILIPLNLLLVKMHWGALWWLNEAVEYALYAGVFLGAPWVLQQGAHVRVDVISSALSKPAAVHLERVIDAIGASLCVVLCYYGTRAMLLEYQDGTLPDKDLRIANWIVLAVFCLSFALLFIEFLFRIRRASRIVEEEKSAPVKAAF